MGTAIALLAVIGLLSIMTTTKDQRAEARRNLARWNPLFLALLLIQLAFVLWPWPKQ